MLEEKKHRCRLCGKYYADKDMSEEHYPAKSLGNYDLVGVNLVDMFDKITSDTTRKKVLKQVENGIPIEEVVSDLFDKELSVPLYPKGRTARTLCKTCNTFIGKYDEAYLKFFNVDGASNKTKGFTLQTKYDMIKAIFAKFLSIPEAKDEEFDFIDFIKDRNNKEYNGRWKLYMVKRDHTTDFFLLKDISTGKYEEDGHIFYELSDDKFMFYLMNFEKEEGIEMTNIFELLNKNYTIIEGVGESGGYHAVMMLSKLFKSENINKKGDK